MRAPEPLHSARGQPDDGGSGHREVTILAVFLAYNANSGLPFVPSYNISAQLPGRVQAGAGQRGADRRCPRRPDQRDRASRGRRDGRAPRVADLKLDPDVEELPVDSTILVRARSPLGLKYLELVRGSSARAPRRLDDGAGAATSPTGPRRAPGHVRRADARGDPGEPGRVRERAGRPAGPTERGARRASGPRSRARAGHGEPRERRDPSRALRRPRSQPPRARSRRSPSSRRSCS